jgi:hypothetical protein
MIINKISHNEVFGTVWPRGLCAYLFNATCPVLRLMKMKNFVVNVH